MTFWRLFYRGFSLIFILANLSSCSARNIEDINESFRAKFGGPAKVIQNSRSAPPNLEQDPAISPALPNSDGPKSPFLRNPPPPLPGSGPAFPASQPSAMYQGPSQSPGSQLPEDMFDLNYNVMQTAPFVALGTEFDVIEIPTQDYFGVKTGLGEKSYMIVGNLDLQKDVDQINNNRDEDDIDISSTLIKERQEQRRQYKMQKIFGDDVATVEKQKIKEEDKEKAENEARKKRLEEEDPIKKAIALQVIQYNMQQNQPPPPQQQAQQ